jgi:hypothetical protein
MISPNNLGKPLFGGAHVLPNESAWVRANNQWQAILIRIVHYVDRLNVITYKRRTRMDTPFVAERRTQVRVVGLCGRSTANLQSLDLPVGF